MAETEQKRRRYSPILELLASRSGIRLQRYSLPPRTIDAGEPDSRHCRGPAPRGRLRGNNGVGKTGVVGVLRNGDGPAIMLRADMDALPVREATGLPYASNVSADRKREICTGDACLRP